MTTGHWDAQAWDKAWKKQHRRRRTTPTNRTKILVAIAAASLVLTGAAVAGGQTIWDDPEQIGVCHATGSDSQPYVFLVVEKDGYEHGHHRHHDGDFFRDPEVGHCGDDELAAGGPNGTDGNGTDGNGTQAPDNGTSPPENGTDDGGADVPGNGTGDGDGATDNGTAGDGNQTTPPDNTTGPPDNATDDGGNGTAEEDASGNDTAPAGDAAVRQSALQDDFEVVLTLVVASVGEGNASEVVLRDQLPDVRRPWAIAGADASQCVLDGLALTCWFGELEPGETREVQLRAYIDRLPCGQSVTNTAHVEAVDDVEPRNDSSSASVHARVC